jgi:hypothetical protein
VGGANVGSCIGFKRDVLRKVGAEFAVASGGSERTVPPLRGEVALWIWRKHGEVDGAIDIATEVVELAALRIMTDGSKVCRP